MNMQAKFLLSPFFKQTHTSPPPPPIHYSFAESSILLKRVATFSHFVHYSIHCIMSPTPTIQFNFSSLGHLGIPCCFSNGYLHYLTRLLKIIQVFLILVIFYSLSISYIILSLFSSYLRITFQSLLLAPHLLSIL